MKKLTESEKKEIVNELGFSSPDINIGGNFDPHPKRKDGDSKNQGVFLQKFSSPEARGIIDGAMKNWVADLRKSQHRIIKDWMKAAKANQIDFFDLVRGIKTGDFSRAHPYETTFLASVLTRDKIIDRFRSYFKGKKGKPRK